MLNPLQKKEAVRAFLTGGLALALALGLKAFYSDAGADELLWVLGPSAWLASFLGGIDMVYEHGAGYISHTYHMVVGPPCAGVNFLVICFLCLYFSFARHFPGRARWFLLAALIAFGGTIAANSLRIFVSAHLWNADFYRNWVTQEDMHRLAGIAIYYASLLALYIAVESRVGSGAHRIGPLTWYLVVSLGVPLIGRIVAGGTPGFASHAAWVVGVALLLTLVKALPTAVRNRIHFRT
jgi:exosortase K